MFSINALILFHFRRDILLKILAMSVINKIEPFNIQALPITNSEELDEDVFFTFM